MKSNFDLCREAFTAINEFKRSRTLADVARSEGDISSAIHNELKTFKAFDRVELAIRAIQSNERYSSGSEETKEDRPLRAINSR